MSGSTVEKVTPTLPMHNIGFDRPRLTHAHFVLYLKECASRWANIPNGHDQAERVYREAIRQERVAPIECPVCSRILREAGAL